MNDSERNNEAELTENTEEFSHLAVFDLEQDRKIYLDTEEIDENIINIQQKILKWNMEDQGVPKDERQSIHIYITTGGGDVSLMWTLVDTIEASTTPVYTVNIGQAASAGGIIFMSGHKRFMFPHAKVLIHEGSASIEGDIHKIRNWYELCEMIMQESKDYILKKTTIPSRLLQKKRKDDWTLNAADCLKYGVCDEIVSSIEQII